MLFRTLLHLTSNGSHALRFSDSGLLTQLSLSRGHILEGGVSEERCLAFRTAPKLLAVREPLLAKCQAGVSCWPTVILLIFKMSSSSILGRRTKQSSCYWSPPVWRNYSVNISSIAEIGSLLTGGGSGLSSQQRPVSSYSCAVNLYWLSSQGSVLLEGGKKYWSSGAGSTSFKPFCDMSLSCMSSACLRLVYLFPN